MISANRLKRNSLGARVLILGAGGAARGLVVSLLDQGVQSITIANRSRGTSNAIDPVSTAIPVGDSTMRTGRAGGGGQSGARGGASSGGYGGGAPAGGGRADMDDEIPF